jgi:hypothetical protein
LLRGKKPDGDASWLHINLLRYQGSRRKEMLYNLLYCSTSHGFAGDLYKRLL